MEWLFPTIVCIACGSGGELYGGLCARCTATLSELALPPEQKGFPQAGAPDYSLAVGAFPYRGCARAVVRALKFHGNAAPARAHLIPGMVRLGAQLNREWSVVVPVPLCKARMVERGYNQAAILARGVALSLGLPLKEGVLWRVRRTSQQAKLSRDARLANVRDAFSADKRVGGHRVLLIDDVFTSGATVSSCARALLDRGAACVDVLCGIRALLEEHDA